MFGQLDALNLELARHDSGGGADGHVIEADGVGGDQATDAMMVHDFHDFGVGKTVSGLHGLVVVDQDHLVAFAHMVDHARRLDAVFAQNPLGLRRKAAQTTCLVYGILAIFASELVLQICVAHSGGNCVVVGILVTKHQNRRSHRCSSLTRVSFCDE